VQSRRAAPADDSRGSRVTGEPASSPRAGRPPEGSRDDDDAGVPAVGRDRADLSGLSIAGITRRRVGFVASALVGLWIVVVFARQVGDATTAANRATQLAADNAALAAEVESLQGEVDAITKPAHVSLAARAYQLGAPKEIAFTLDPSVPSPGDGAPGSASVRLGATPDRQTPLESWLSLLFGPAS
jgi:cell division protein FtsB